MRVISLTPSSIRFFKSIGLWEHIDERLIKYIKGMQVWENKGSSHLHMDTSDSKSLSALFDYLPGLIPAPRINSEYICGIIEINHLVYALQKLLKDKLVIVNQNLQYDNILIENDEQYASLLLKNEGIRYDTKLLVAGDGAKSVVRNKLGITTTGYDYNETGLVCTLRGNVSSDIAYQRFLHNGIFALLPLYDDLYSIVCSMPKNINEGLLNLDDQAFIAFINELLHNPSESQQLGQALFTNNFSSPPVITEILSKRIEFPLQLQYARDNVYRNCVLIGDAAHVVHPMAGQGMNLGIADAALLSDTIVGGLNNGKRVNDKRSLEGFAFSSQMNYKSMIGVIEALKMTYSQTDDILSGIRNIGTSVFNKSSYIKGLFMLAASGELGQPSKYSWEKE
jgi:ubiquinone biosynthesis monooxygenase Coq6